PRPESNSCRRFTLICVQPGACKWCSDERQNSAPAAHAECLRSTSMTGGVLGVRDLGLTEYEPAWQAMQRFTNTRGPATDDEIWLLQHLPVFTQGQAGKAEHLLLPGDIPVVQAD